jgi:2'-5' RNA ligase
VHNLEQGLISCGFQPERRNYTPHVTLARKARSEQPAVVADPVVWRPREFVLAASHSGAGLPRYKILDRWYI